MSSTPLAEKPGDIAIQRSAAEPSIQLRSVGVRFDLPEDRIRSLKEYVLSRLSRRVSRREFWALRSIDLEVARGETLGIIGSNGAGKSSLLKVICRVLRPTLGRVVVRGRVAPLLELGAGFHPDMSGRENIRINATILGYGRRRIAERTEDVIEFSELRHQIESPVRNYSRGMVARLGFAVATLCRPDVLVLDEILAVGDEHFRAKCLERLQAFRARGTTTLLVSHALGTVRESCDRAAWIDQGGLVRVGPSAEVVAAYQEVAARDRAPA